MILGRDFLKKFDIKLVQINKLRYFKQSLLKLNPIKNQEENPCATKSEYLYVAKQLNLPPNIEMVIDSPVLI